MTAFFYVASALTLLGALLAVTARRTVHALLYLVVSLVSMATLFYALNAALPAALLVIIYAGAIIVLFLFAVMLAEPKANQRLTLQRPTLEAWGHSLAAIAGLLLLLIFSVASGDISPPDAAALSPAENTAVRQAALLLFERYPVGVEMASMLLLAGLVGAYHLGRRVDSGSTSQ